MRLKHRSKLQRGRLWPWWQSEKTGYSRRKREAATNWKQRAVSQDKGTAMCCRRLERPGHRTDQPGLQGYGLIPWPMHSWANVFTQRKPVAIWQIHSRFTEAGKEGGRAKRRQPLSLRNEHCSLRARQQPLESQFWVVLSSQGGSSPHYNRQDRTGLFCVFLKGCTAKGEKWGHREEAPAGNLAGGSAGNQEQWNLG